MTSQKLPPVETVGEVLPVDWHERVMNREVTGLHKGILTGVASSLGKMLVKKLLPPADIVFEVADIYGRAKAEAHARLQDTLLREFSDTAGKSSTVGYRVHEHPNLTERFDALLQIKRGEPVTAADPDMTALVAEVESYQKTAEILASLEQQERGKAEALRSDSPPQADWEAVNEAYIAKQVTVAQALESVAVEVGVPAEESQMSQSNVAAMPVAEPVTETHRGAEMSRASLFNNFSFTLEDVQVVSPSPRNPVETNVSSAELEQQFDRLKTMHAQYSTRLGNNKDRLQVGENVVTYYSVVSPKIKSADPTGERPYIREGFSIEPLGDPSKGFTVEHYINHDGLISDFRIFVHSKYLSAARNTEIGVDHYTHLKADDPYVLATHALTDVTTEQLNELEHRMHDELGVK